MKARRGDLSCITVFVWTSVGEQVACSAPGWGKYFTLTLFHLWSIRN